MIRFGYGLNEDSNQGRAVKLLAEEVAKASDGKLKVRTFGSASLGSDDQMQNALIGGAQEMMVGSTATLVGITKEMAVWDTPFLFTDPAGRSGTGRAGGSADHGQARGRGWSGWSTGRMAFAT